MKRFESNAMCDFEWRVVQNISEYDYLVAGSIKKQKIDEINRYTRL